MEFILNQREITKNNVLKYNEHMDGNVTINYDLIGNSIIIKSICFRNCYSKKDRNLIQEWEYDYSKVLEN